MTTLARSVITPMENLEDAIAMSVINGQAQFSFAARATTDSSGYSVLPTHCWSSGTVDATIIEAYEADPRFFVSTKVGRQAKQALAEHVPVLYPWKGTTAI
jgi:hypothetical protein